MPRIAPIAVLAGALALGACAVAPPSGPSVMVLPAKDKSFADFQEDDGVCRQFASAQIGNVEPAQAANQTFAGSAAAGTLLGAAAGAAIGAATGNPAAGAAIGAGSGLFLGGATGAAAAGHSAAALQRGYDIAYVQCMSAKGESVPNLAGGTYPDPYGYYYPYGAYAYDYPYPYYYPYYYSSPFFGSTFVAFGFHHHHRRFR